MNRTIVFVTVAALGVIGFLITSIFAPDSLTAYAGFIATLTGFAILLIQQNGLKEKIDKVDKQTNGTNNVLLAAAFPHLDPTTINALKADPVPTPIAVPTGIQDGLLDPTPVFPTFPEQGPQTPDNHS